MVQLAATNQTAQIIEGELVGYQVDDHEFIHQKGSPGWRNSDTEMFPIIGPTSEVDFKVRTPRGMAVQDQHGLLRELTYELKHQSKESATYQKSYTAGTKISNSKYPEKSTVQKLYWPYDFSFQKIFNISDTGLEITFKISGEEGMPFMLGYHPAFKLHTENPMVQVGDRLISISKIVAVGNRAFQVPNCNAIQLNDKRKVSLLTEGFGSFMLWSEVTNMVCIEPITFYPYAVEPKKLHKGFMHLHKEEGIFRVTISTAK